MSEPAVQELRRRGRAMEQSDSVGEPCVCKQLLHDSNSVCILRLHVFGSSAF